MDLGHGTIPKAGGSSNLSGDSSGYGTWARIARTASLGGGLPVMFARLEIQTTIAPAPTTPMLTKMNQ